MTRFNVRRALGAMVAGAVLMMAGARLSYAASDSELIAQAQQTLALYKKADPGINEFLQSSAGYVVFPGIGKGGLVVGAAHGDGVVFVGGRPVGRATLNQVSVGAQVGGQEYSEIIFFQTPQVLSSFEKGQFTMAAQASAVALKAGAAAQAKYQNGVAVFTATKGGLMAEASIGGQKFSFTAFH
jgi:lipid-binding SYLF domain-containing protein